MVGGAAVANAIPTLYVSSTGLAGSWTAVASGTSGDLNFAGSLDGWHINASTTLSLPALGSPGVPAMGLDVTGTTSTGGYLWLAYFDAGAFAGVAGRLQATITGQVLSGAPETFSFETLANTSTVQPTTTFSTGSPVTALSGSLPNYLTASGVLPATIPNSLGIILEISANGGSMTSVQASCRSVPDGGATVLLLGGALSGLVLFKRRLKTRLQLLTRSGT